jgi:hypothetical protein
VDVASKPGAVWWRGVSHPPPAAWTYTFEEFTGNDSADEWALAAAIFIAQHRRRHAQGPTFRELFEHLLPDTNGIPSSLPAEWDVVERRRGNNGFRKHVVIEWRRRGYINCDRDVTRSLRVGPRFREQSRERRGARAHRTAEDPWDRPTDIESATTPDSLSVDAVLALLRVTPAYLERLSRHGFLHAVECGGERRYPTWQFAGHPRSPVVPGINVVGPAIPTHWNPATIHTFMTSQRRELGFDGSSDTPLQWLIDGYDPHQIVRILTSFDCATHEHDESVRAAPDHTRR